MLAEAAPSLKVAFYVPRPTEKAVEATAKADAAEASVVKELKAAREAAASPSAEIEAVSCMLVRFGSFNLLLFSSEL